MEEDKLYLEDGGGEEGVTILHGTTSALGNA